MPFGLFSTCINCLASPARLSFILVCYSSLDYNSAMRKGAKRMVVSRTSHKDAVVESDQNDEMMVDSMEVLTQPDQEAAAAPRSRASKRNLEDLWKAAFPVGAEWDKFDTLYKFNWDFKNLEEAIEEEGGILYGKKVFVFGTSEPQLVFYGDSMKVIDIPAIVAVESPFPPSDKIGITSVYRATERIVPMKQMKMHWVPYIPFDKRDKQVDRIKFQIFILVCTQRRVALRHMKEESVKEFEFCLPYIYQPFQEDEFEQRTVVTIVFPSEPPVICDYDWDLDDDIEEFVDKILKGKEFSSDKKEKFKEFVKREEQAAKKANREAKVARRKAREEMSEDTKQAFQSMKFYKFYPRPSPDVPQIQKSPSINRYYGKAHHVL